jgi:hypothetical protein
MNVSRIPQARPRSVNAAPCRTRSVAVPLAAALACACGSGNITTPYVDEAGSAASAMAGVAAVSGRPGSVTPSGAAGGASPITAAGGSAAASDPGASTGPSAAAVASDKLPARIRRLTNSEFDSSVKALFGMDSKFGASFTPDTRQDGFTRNDAQRVDPVFMTQLDAAAKQIAAQLKPNLRNMAWCDGNADATALTACARKYFMTLLPKAYRRPVDDRELDALLSVYSAGADGAAYEDGLALAVQALLEAPGFLYVTELGAGQPTADAQLNEYEIANALAFLLTGAPPDDALTKAAAAGELHTPDARKLQAQRLLMTDPASKQVTRMIEEWLGIDRIIETAKDSTVYPDFQGLRDAMKREADDFIAEVMWKQGSGVSTLFSADWTPAEDGLARMYLGGDQAPMRTDNHVSLASTKRRGILNQGAFLSVYAHAQETAPVLRGVAVLRRVACYDVPPPTSLNINIVPPVADPQKTTRERFAIHSRDAACAGCHNQIDAIGFTFEGLDGMGKARTMENGRPIDSSTMVKGGFSFDGSYADSAALAMQLASSSELQTCFARHLFRTASARNTAGEGAETAFLASVAALPASAAGKFADVLTAFIASDLFVARRAGQ